jgi:hypothetical protein
MLGGSRSLRTARAPLFVGSLMRFKRVLLQLPGRMRCRKIYTAIAPAEGGGGGEGRGARVAFRSDRTSHRLRAAGLYACDVSG